MALEFRKAIDKVDWDFIFFPFVSLVTGAN